MSVTSPAVFPAPRSNKMDDQPSKKTVTRLAMLTVVPSKVTPPNKIYPLANLDHMMARHNIRLIYYYQTNANSTADLIKNLERSLSAVLSSYPAVCGRLVRRADGNWEINCNDAGVRVIEAKVSITLNEWLLHADRLDELALCHWEPIGPDPSISSLFFVQFTEFHDGGLAVGLSCAHMFADPSCATLIMKAWGEVHRRAQVLHPPFFHPPGLKARPNRRDTTTATKYYEATFCKKPSILSDSYTTVSFKFSSDAVHRCLSEVDGGPYGGYEDSMPFEALATLFWGACARAKGRSAEDVFTLSVCSEFRKLIISPLPHGFFGNAVHFSEVSATVAELAEKGLSFGARLIHDDVDRLEREELRSVVEWLEGQKSREGTLPRAPYFYGPQLTAVNGENFFTYDAVFLEQQKPLHVSYYVEPVHGEGLIFVSPSAEGEFSRTVFVTLPGDQADRLCADPEIRRFSPTLWMKPLD